MIVVRSIEEVAAGAVTIQLPVDFTAKRVEVIVLPVEEYKPELSELQRLLLAAPMVSEDSLQQFTQSSEWMT